MQTKSTTADEPRLATLEQLEQLYRAYYADLRHYAAKLAGDPELGEAAVHQIFFQLWSRRKNTEAVRSWWLHLLAALREQALQLLREKQATADPEAAEKGMLFLLSAEEFTLREPSLTHKQTLTHALGTLRPRQREILYLRYQLEVDYGDMADLLNLRYQVVVDELYEAMLQLRASDVLKQLVYL